MRMRVVACGVLVMGLLTAASARAFPIADPGTEGLKIFVTGTDPIIATYEGNSADYMNLLYFVVDGFGQQGDQDGNAGNDIYMFNNHQTPVGTTFDLGSFPIGTELVFRLHVTNTGDDFFTGPSSRNGDGQPHARVQDNWMPMTTLVSFEDLFNGPFDYNDLSFSFTNTSTVPAVPEPMSLILFGTGLVGLAARFRLRGLRH